MIYEWCPEQKQMYYTTMMIAIVPADYVEV